MKLSVPHIILLGTCMSVLACLLVLNTLNTQRTRDLNIAVDSLSDKDSGLLILEKSRYELLLAENEYRGYLSTREPESRKAYLAHLDNFITSMESMAALSPAYLHQLKLQLKDKIDLAALVVTLKNSADSLLSTANQLPMQPVNDNITLQQPFSAKILEKYFLALSDTVRIVPLRRKRGFFKKVGELFRVSGKSDSLQVIHQKNQVQENRKDSLGNIAAQKAKALSFDIRDYYQKLINQEIELRKQIDEKEQESARKNMAMLGKMEQQTSLLWHSVQVFHEQNMAGAAGSLQKNGRGQNTLFHISLLVIGLVSVLLVYSIYKAFYYEKNMLAAKNKAEQLASLKTRFLNNMSHEIRTPLTAIIGFTEYLQTSGSGNDPKEYLEVIKIASDHLLATVNDILDYSKLEAGKIELREYPFMVKKLVDETMKLYVPAAKKKKLKLTAHYYMDETFTIVADPYRLKQVLYNLLNNAIKFTDEGFVKLSIDTVMLPGNKQGLACYVADSGIGIPKERASYIFEEFAQVSDYDNRIKRSLAGTGLGLSICKKLVEFQGGSISVESEPKKGAVFTFSIPVALSDPDMIKVEPEKDQEAGSLKGKRVLVAEDSEFNIKLMSLLLARYSMDFHIAKDGEHALNLFNLNHYDLVLTDIHIPKLSGYQLAYAIRKDTNPEKNTIPVIAVTASPVNDDFQLYYNSGINEIITKPFREAELKASLLQHLQLGSNEPSNV